MFSLSGKYRAIVRKNILLAFGDQYSTSELQQLVKETFLKNGGNFFTTVAAARKSTKSLKERVSFENLEEFKELVAEGKGVIVVLGHMGNWEILTRLKSVVELEVRVGALYRPLNNKYFDKHIHESRSKGGMELFSYRKTGLQIVRLLKKGGIFCVLSDQRIGGQGEVANYFGRMVRCSRLPTTLSNSTKSPVVTLSMQSVGKGRWKVSFQKPEQEGEQLEHQEITTSLEKALSQSPSDVFWFQDRWKLVRPVLQQGDHTKPIQVLVEKSECDAHREIVEALQKHENFKLTQSSALSGKEIISAEYQQGRSYDLAIGFLKGSDFLKGAKQAGISSVLGFGEAFNHPLAWHKLGKPNADKTLKQQLTQLGLGKPK